MEATQETHSPEEAHPPEETPPPTRPPLQISTQDLLTAPHPHAPDSPTTMLITTLRDELSTLTHQSTVLNAKLLASLDRVATLEDAVYQATSAQREKEERIARLEQQKAQWEESMNTGLLVERQVVKDEMQRLVDGLVEEEKRRGSAEEGRARVEREVDDLSATLFEQANTMVAAERMARAQAESRLREAEDNLQATESALRDMQHHLQSLPALLPAADVPTRGGMVKRYNTAHVPYTEFLGFIHHLRLHKPRKPDHLALFPPPALSTLLAQPFLARAQGEDVEPSLRLDQAPDLSWLTRRSVGQAILAGDLIIEPVSVNTLRAGGKEYASVAHPAEIGCSMCGKPVAPRPKAAELATTGRNNSTSRFSLKPFFSSPSATPSPTSSPGPAATTPRPAPTTLFVFRITSVDPSASSSSESSGRMYPLCASGWCLARLRAVCEWWRFVRVCMVDVIWRGDDLQPPAASQRGSVTQLATTGSSTVSLIDSTEASTPTQDDVTAASSAPDLPPRRKSGGWTLGFKSLGGGRGLGFTSKPGSPTSGAAAALALTSPGGGDDRDGMTNGTDSATEIVRLAEEAPAGEPVDRVEKSDEAKPEGEQAGEIQPQQVPENQSTYAQETTPAGDTNPETEAQPVSSAASETSENPNGFSTPQTSSAPLSPEQDHVQPAEDSHANGQAHKTDSAVEAADEDTSRNNTEADTSIDLSSPRASISNDTAPAEAALPPTPTRPARRAVPVPPAAPEIPERSRARPASLTLSPRPDASTTAAAAAAETLPITPDPSTAMPLVTPMPARPPTLPARTEKQGSIGREEEGDEVESWESKTWKEIVRLKEEMWRARVGITEEST
ncbi:hypothetical protein NCC49_005877 [Naganishia albida]|nr:hypothetical protein NCC49_005877 [Naganishia albida]